MQDNISDDGYTETTAQQHSEPVQDIITKVPAWIVRWGITLFFLILVFIFIITKFIKYPDLINAKFSIESAYPKVLIVAPRKSTWINTIVKPGQLVQKGKILALSSDSEYANKIDTFFAPQTGQIDFVALNISGAKIKNGETLFIIHPLEPKFFGIAEISASDIINVKRQQRVVVRLRNAGNKVPEINGRIVEVTTEPASNGNFKAKVELSLNNEQKIYVKDWMKGDAQIITNDITLQKRLFTGIFKFLK